MNKNNLIAALVALLLIGSIWGGVANRQKIALKRQLNEKSTELQSFKEHGQIAKEAVADGAAALKENLAQRDKEVAALKQTVKDLEFRLQSAPARPATNAAQTDERFAALEAQLAQRDQELAAIKAAGVAEPQATGQNATHVKEQLQNEKLEYERSLSLLNKNLEMAKAQSLGLEKIVEEKSAVIDEISAELDRFKVNTDVLLAKISDQQDGVQELQEENRNLAKELSEKNEQLTELQEKLIQTPVSSTK